MLRKWFTGGLLGDEFELIKEQGNDEYDIELVVSETGVLDEFYIVVFDKFSGHVEKVKKAVPYKVVETRYKSVIVDK